MSLRASPHNRPQLDMPRLSDACTLRLAHSFEARNLISVPTPLPLVEVQHEAEGIVTLWVQVPHSLASQYRPGQYFMCWNPYDSTGGMSRSHHHSEKPYSVGDVRIGHSHDNEWSGTDTVCQSRAFLGFTVKDLGRQSGELTRMRAGDWLAIRGPFGTAFPDMNAGVRLILVSGGIGSTPMHMVAREARHKLSPEKRGHRRARPDGSRQRQPSKGPKPERQEEQAKAAGAAECRGKSTGEAAGGASGALRPVHLCEP